MDEPIKTPQPQPQPQPPAPEPTDTMIPKGRFDEINAKYKEAQTKLSEAEALIAASKDKDTEIANLKQEIDKMKTTYEQEKQTAIKMQAIEKIIAPTAHDVGVVVKLLDLDKITYSEKDGLKGLEEQLESLKKNKAFLFKTAPTIAKKQPPAEPKPDSFAKRLAQSKLTGLGQVAKSKKYF